MAHKTSILPGPTVTVWLMDDQEMKQFTQICLKDVFNNCAHNQVDLKKKLNGNLGTQLGLSMKIWCFSSKKYCLDIFPKFLVTFRKTNNWKKIHLKFF